MSLNNLILKNDIDLKSNIQLMSILLRKKELYDVVSICCDFPIYVQQFCKTLTINIISDEVVYSKDIVTDLSTIVRADSDIDVADNRLEILKKFKMYIGDNQKELYKHSLEVANETSRLCKKNGIDELVGFKAGLLHDVGGIIKTNYRELVADILGIDLYFEERTFPLIIHQKLSQYIVVNELKIRNNSLAEAVGCHTTLRGQYTKLDLILFLADKIKWDQSGTPPYLDTLVEYVERLELEKAALFYINYLLDNTIKIKHPWLMEAKKTLERNIFNEQSN